MKPQEKDEGFSGLGGAGGPSGVAQNIKGPPKKKKDSKAASLAPLRKTPMSKKKETASAVRELKELKLKELKKKKDGASFSPSPQQSKSSKDKQKKFAGSALGGAPSEKKTRKSVGSDVKKKKPVTNGTAKDDKKRRDDPAKDGNVVGSAVAANGWGFGTEVLTCLPRRVASLNAMAKVHIMYENETNRSTQHATSSSSNTNNSVAATSNATSNSCPTLLNMVSNGIVNGETSHLGSSTAEVSNEVVAPPASTGSSQPTTEVDTDSDVTIEAVSTTNNGHSSPRVDRKMMTVAIPGRCRRMASLNAQAILAASLCHDEKRPKKKEPPVVPPTTPATAGSEPSTSGTSPSSAGVSAGSVIKIEDIEEEEKNSTVEEEEIVQIVQTTKIRRRKMRTSKTSSSPPKALRPKLPKKGELEEIANKETNNTVETKVSQLASTSVTEAQVTRTFSYSTTSTVSSSMLGVGQPGTSGGNNLTLLTRPPLVLNPPQQVPLQNQAATFSLASSTAVNAQNPQGVRAQLQSNTVYLNANMNVNPGGYLVAAPHIAVQQSVQPTASFGLTPTYYQVPLIHKPIAFHPNGPFVGVQGSANAVPVLTPRVPARNLVVHLPESRQENGTGDTYPNRPGPSGVQAQTQQQQQQPPQLQRNTPPVEVVVPMVVKNQSRSNGVAGGAAAGRITVVTIQDSSGSSSKASGDSMACSQTAVGAAAAVGKRGKMQVPPASGLGSAVAKLERNSDKEKKSGVLTGIKVDTPIKNSPGKRKQPHGWSWLGEPFLKKVCTSNEQQYGYGAQVRWCYNGIQHQEGDIIRPRDCVLLKSGPRVIDLPFVAKVGSLWQTPEGEMMISLLWYYRPEHTEQGRRSNHMEDEIFASKHCDYNSVACIEDKCYVLSFAEYCRYRSKVKQLEEGVKSRVARIVPPLNPNPRQSYLPDPGRVTADLVFFCRKVYDYRQKRILKNPTVQVVNTRDS
ncbi:uncharacterized protein LOC100898140 [Galendromus occidentalis]|uniref:Uncharacterized protein LOC100898140 n=1 Tax=Galendromus occidentalis TaxID=34638 RepID=A0AAJ7L700_9ACAR|nr:uncharacterized protein LOC100898140 [Galendromus occidentalis]